MNLAGLSLGVFTGICLHAGVTQFIAARRAPIDRLLLTFSVLCLLSVVFGVSQFHSFEVRSPAELAVALKWVYAMVTLVYAVFPWFVAEATGIHSRFLLVGASLVMLALFVANLTAPYSLQYDTLPELIQLRLPWGELIAQPHGTITPIFRLAAVTVLLITGYAVYAFFRHYRREPTVTTLAILIAMTIVLATVVQGILVRMSIINFLPLGPYGILLMIVTMSAVLSHELRRRGERMQAALREAQSLRQAILDHAGHSIISSTVDGTITSFNRAAERMLGYSAAEVIGLAAPVIIHDPAEVAARAEQFSAELGMPIKPGFEVFVAKARRDLPNEHEWTYVRKDGSRFPVLLTVTALRAVNGAITGFLGLAIDISERKRAEAELLHHREHLEEVVEARTSALEAANKELEAFSYSVSHDLRAPLRAIDGFTLALVEEYADGLDDTARDYLRRIRNGAQRMDALIEDLLKLSRIGQVALQPATVDLSAMAAEIISELAASSPNHQVATEITPGLSARGDAQLLHVVLTNLLGNAWKYTGKTTAPRIEFGALTKNGEKVYFIRDNGAGFDMRYADNLFGAFQRLHGSEFPGTGIGLATVTRILQRHGGRVWAEAQPGKGATFFFTTTFNDGV